MLEELVDLERPCLNFMDGMIQFTLDCQESYRQQMAGVNPKSWLKEFCTMRFCLPRRSGHTFSAMYLSRKYFSNPIFIVPNADIREFYKRTYKELFDKDLKIFNTFEQLIGIDNIECLIIDVSSFVSQMIKERIYDLNFKRNNKNLILFLE